MPPYQDAKVDGALRVSLVCEVLSSEFRKLQLLAGHKIHVTYCTAKEALCHNKNALSISNEFVHHVELLGLVFHDHGAWSRSHAEMNNLAHVSNKC